MHVDFDVGEESINYFVTITSLSMDQNAVMQKSIDVSRTSSTTEAIDRTVILRDVPPAVVQLYDQQRAVINFTLELTHSNDTLPFDVRYAAIIRHDLIDPQRFDRFNMACNSSGNRVGNY